MVQSDVVADSHLAIVDAYVLDQSRHPHWTKEEEEEKMLLCQ